MPARKQVKIRRIGNSLGATLPKVMLDELHLSEGSTVTAVQTKDGILLTPYDADFEATMAAYEVIASKYRNALRELAR